jgi:hypothetical protein
LAAGPKNLVVNLLLSNVVERLHHNANHAAFMHMMDGMMALSVVVMMQRGTHDFGAI